MNRTLAGTFNAFCVAPATTPVCLRPSVVLEALDRSGEFRVPRLLGGMGRVQIALDSEALAQLRDLRALSSPDAAMRYWSASPRRRRWRRNARKPWRWRKTWRAGTVGCGSLESAVSRGGAGGVTFLGFGGVATALVDPAGGGDRARRSGRRRGSGRRGSGAGSGWRRCVRRLLRR